MHPQESSSPPASPAPIGRAALARILMLALLGAVCFLGTRGLFETTEGRYAECARESALAGDLWSPVLHGEPHWTKPPMAYLAIHAGIRVFGVNPWGARAYLALAFVIMAGAVGWAGACLWGAESGFWAGVVAATSPILIGTASVVSTDMLVTLWAAVALAAFWQYRSRPSPGAGLLIWISLGLANFTKGPPALLVPATVILTALLLDPPHGAQRPRPVAVAAGVAVFLLIGFGWYIEQALRHPGLLQYWVGKELIARNVSDEFNRNPGFRFVLTQYLPILLFGTGVWLWFVLVPLLRPRSRIALLPLPPARSATGSKVWATMLGVILPVTVFSLSTSKLPLYLSPVFVPLSLLLGHGLDRLLRAREFRRTTLLATAALTLAFSILMKGAIATREMRKDMSRLADRLQPLLTQHPERTLSVVSDRHLNGLEFELGRELPLIPPGDLETRLQEDRTEKGPGVALYLASRKDWTNRIETFSPSPGVTPVGPHWILLDAAPGPQP